eukprot:393790-Pleurochrysis_carterae.AAC.1
MPAVHVPVRHRQFRGHRTRRGKRLFDMHAEIRMQSKKGHSALRADGTADLLMRLKTAASTLEPFE